MIKVSGKRLQLIMKEVGYSNFTLIKTGGLQIKKRDRKIVL
jgi:hypothetical protein